eukprot:CAMPEP_0170182436 /NCGR_PEP_ID=MMETSP0040_2-20121228/27861_1 /TAXON_ID=641309 /ORGANISM="Lotharella oceanica, Strain CCMP622" /LENGTH=164 /DNA_ID=CAMNT_0010427849 /DNA_START=77 /DNA_END=567 /DNA_ORIENTATION=-
MTCCNRTHTDRLKMKALAYFDADVPEQCRNWAGKALCSECEPAMGTKERAGICKDMCDEWYSACADTMFTTSSVSTDYSPCNFNSLLCWRLGDVIQSGEEFCRKQGYTVSNDQRLCYDGQMHPKYKKKVKDQYAHSKPQSKAQSFFHRLRAKLLSSRPFIMVLG